ncbi:MAG: TerB family tellurite resistance protein [Bdellovibrionales bacterium]|nr:TerB family tellurite resistance protein [Bdellovibrionales bacterium]
MAWFDKQTDGDVQAEAIGEPTAKGLNEQETIQRNVFISTFAMLAKMASADGTVSKNEVEAVDRFMKQVLKLDDARRSFAIKVFNRARTSTKTFRDYAEEYRELLKDTPEMYEWMVDVLARVSLADQVFSNPEASLLYSACEVFGVDPGRYAKLAQHLQPAAVAQDDEVYQRIGCSPTSSDEEIAAKVSQLEQQFDPEHIVAMGLPEEFVKVAQEKRKAVQEAHQEIRRRRGR